MLSAEKVDEFNARGGDAAIGAFGENILVSGIDFKKLPVGSSMRSGEVVMKLTQIGKECHAIARFLRVWATALCHVRAFLRR